MYISCIFHVVCATFSALATRKLADANPVSSGIWALVIDVDYQHQFTNKSHVLSPLWVLIGVLARLQEYYFNYFYK